ncbi:MAG: histidine kinase [Oscillospiraceae bacterium]|nr:histidine kinase [Oscillospiraceae bacterium]
MRTRTKSDRREPFISIRNKLLMIFLIPTVLLLSMNIYMYASINTMIDDIRGVYESNSTLSELQISLSQVHRYLEGFLDTRDTEALEGYLRSQQEYSNILQGLNNRLFDDGNMVAQKNIRSISEKYLERSDLAIEAKRGRNVVKYKEYYDDANRLFSYINSYIYSLNNRQLQSNSKNYEALFSSLKYSETANLAVLCITVALVSVLVFLLTRGITNPLQRLSEAAGRVADGSLDAEVSGPVSNDEVGIVTAAFNQMVARVKENIEQIKQRMEFESAMKEKQLMMESHLKDTQLKYLQSQINPHFLFNTLNAGAQLAMLEGADKTYSYVQNVADFYRYNVRKKDGVATLGEEIALVDNYIYIINVRFAGEIHFIKEIEEGAADVSVPAMILQPLVENSINHGLRDVDWEKKIWLSVYRENDRICVCVRDNGVGMSPEQTKSLMENGGSGDGSPENGTGVGLRNVIGRLRLFYDRDDVIEITSTGFGMGTEVAVFIPV